MRFRPSTSPTKIRFADFPSVRFHVVKSNPWCHARFAVMLGCFASASVLRTGIPHFVRDPILRSKIGPVVPEGIRTPDPRLRRPLLYPAELRTHFLPCTNVVQREKRVMGIEPTYPAWKAGVLPLNYTRIRLFCLLKVGVTGFEPATS